MTSNEDYRLEEAEKAAINKSRMAKRAIGTATATAVGVGMGYAASRYFSDTDTTGDTPTGGNAGHAPSHGYYREQNPYHEPELQAEPEADANHDTELQDNTPHVPHATRASHIPDNQVTSDNSGDYDTADSGIDSTGDNGYFIDTAGSDNLATDDPDVTFTGTTAVIDPETGEYIGGFDAGTVGGQNFMLMDEDGDTEADILAIDENGNGIFEDSEMLDVTGQGIAIGNSEDINIISTDELYDAISDDGSGGEMPHNDWYDDQADISVDNPDYVNDADLGGSTAGATQAGGILSPGDTYFPEEDGAVAETVTGTATVEDSAVYDTVRPDDIDGIDGNDAGMIADAPIDFL